MSKTSPAERNRISKMSTPVFSGLRDLVHTCPVSPGAPLKLPLLVACNPAGLAPLSESLTVRPALHVQHPKSMDSASQAGLRDLLA